MLIAIHDYLDWFFHRAVMDWHASRERRTFHRVLPDGPGSTLVIRFGSLGDVVRSTAVVQALAEQYQAVDVLTSSGCVPVFEDSPHVKRVFTDSADIREQYDWIVNLQVAEPLSVFVENYRDQLRLLRGRFWSGNRFVGENLQRTYVYNYYCYQEIEELYRVALLRAPKDAPLRVRIYNKGVLPPGVPETEKKRIGLSAGTSPPPPGDYRNATVLESPAARSC
jgi:hypothetical protein